MSEPTTLHVFYLCRNLLWELSRLKFGHHPPEQGLPRSINWLAVIEGPLAEDAFEVFVVLSCCGTEGWQEWELLDQWAVRTVSQFPARLADARGRPLPRLQDLRIRLPGGKSKKLLDPTRDASVLPLTHAPNLTGMDRTSKVGPRSRQQPRGFAEEDFLDLIPGLRLGPPRIASYAGRGASTPKESHQNASKFAFWGLFGDRKAHFREIVWCALL